jgi:hypothetical protein
VLKKAAVSDDELATLVATLDEDLVGLRDRALLTSLPTRSSAPKPAGDVAGT